MIPKIIHQTWKTKEVPGKWVPLVRKVQTLNPGWEYKLWTDADNEGFVRDEFPEFYKIFMGFSRAIMRADVIRYLIMSKIGGVYLDLDYEVLKPFDFGNHSLILPLNRSLKNGDPKDALGNCFFASAPGQPFWQDVINDLRQNPPSVSDPSQITKATGPLFLTRVYESHKDHYRNIYLPDKMIYHPSFPNSKKNRKRIRRNGVSLGMHHPWGSWKERRTFNYIKKKILLYIKTVMKLKTTLFILLLGISIMARSAVFDVTAFGAKNNIEFHFETGAVLLATTDLSQYQRHNEQLAGVFYTEDATRVSITGEGQIFGQGMEFMYQDSAKIIKGEVNKTIRQKYDFRKVESGIGDGPDIISSSNVNVSDCIITCGDDAIVLAGYVHYFSDPGLPAISLKSCTRVTNNADIQ